MQFSEGQIVAIKIDSEGEGDTATVEEWLLTRYMEMNDGEHVVEDLDSKQVIRVANDRIRCFPDNELVFKKGDNLFSAWYDIEQQQWTNILYPCHALEDYPSVDEPESIVVKVLFDGDPTEYLINTQWVIRNMDQPPAIE